MAFVKSGKVSVCFPDGTEFITLHEVSKDSDLIFKGSVLRCNGYRYDSPLIYVAKTDVELEVISPESLLEVAEEFEEL